MKSAQEIRNIKLLNENIQDRIDNMQSFEKIHYDRNYAMKSKNIRLKI